MIQNKRNRKLTYRQRLCRVCIYGRVDREQGFVCKFTGKKPDFYMVCPSFKLYKARADKIFEKEANDSFSVGKIIVFYIFLAALFLFINLPKEYIYFPLVLFVLLILGIAVYLDRLPNFDIVTIGWFRFLFFATIGYALQTKDYDDDDRFFVKQLIISYYGSDIISKANDIFRKDSLKLFELKKFVKKIYPRQRLFIFFYSCKVYIFNNLHNFKNDGTIEKLRDFLKISKDEADEIIEKLISEEEEFQQKKKQAETERQKYREQQSKRRRRTEQGRRLVSSKVYKYYLILGLSEKASNDEIKKKFKKLALKYHPDRYVNNPQKQHEAQEKFKELSEAYNFLKNYRGF